MTGSINKKEADELKNTVNDKYLGLPGALWCVFAGLCYGTMNVFAKLAYERGMIISRFVMMRFFVLLIASYTFGKIVRKTDFDLRKYNRKSICIVFFRSTLSLFSKVLQYSAIAYIPLSVSSCISFTTGPIFAALLSFVLIREKLTLSEILSILCGIIGTMMLTMPQWFLWMGIDATAIQSRLSDDTKDHIYYYFGISIALGSSAIDVVTYFLIRKVGTTIPKAIFPFISGIIATTLIMIYCAIYEPLDWGYFFTTPEQKAASDPNNAGKELAPDTSAEYTTAI